MVKTLEWMGNGQLKYCDQTKLPFEKSFATANTKEEVYNAIQCLSIRGAPAIGIAAAYGICVDIYQFHEKNISLLKNQINNTATYLKSSRPTAVNLFWAIDKMVSVSDHYKGANVSELKDMLIRKAMSIHDDDQLMCQKIGEYGSALIKDGMNILTHCNAGKFATGGNGTALAVIYQAVKDDKKIHVYVDETRPLLQGSRLTAFELMDSDIPVTLICDSAAGFLMKQKKIDIIITGADRIALNGDTANKIGTYTLAKMASQFDIPFYIAAPSSTFDRKAETEEDIPIECRDKNEIICGMGKQTAPFNVSVYNPAFDVTDFSLINGFITEKGIIKEPFEKNIRDIIF